MQPKLASYCAPLSPRDRDLTSIRLNTLLRSPRPQLAASRAREAALAQQLDAAQPGLSVRRLFEIEIEIGTPKRTRAWTLGAVGWASRLLSARIRMRPPYAPLPLPGTALVCGGGGSGAAGASGGQLAGVAEQRGRESQNHLAASLNGWIRLSRLHPASGPNPTSWIFQVACSWPCDRSSLYAMCILRVQDVQQGRPQRALVTERLAGDGAQRDELRRPLLA
jgi:hypothetical protein